MSIADTNRVSVLYAVESSWGETPSSPDMTSLRVTSESLTHQKQTSISSEIRSDRMKSDVIETGARAEGDLLFELSYGGFNDFLEGAVQGSFVTASVSSVSLDFASNTITAGSSVFGDFMVGQWVKISGAHANNDGLFKVSAKTDTVLTLSGASFTTDTTSDAMVAGKILRNGTTPTSFVLEKRFNDIAKYVYFTGMMIDRFNVAVDAKNVVRGGFSFVGKSGFSSGSSVAGSVTSANISAVFNSSANVGSVQEGGVALTTAVQSIELSYGNNLRLQNVVGDIAPSAIGSGSIDLSGSLVAYFENHSLYQKFLDHTSSSVSFRLTDADDQVIVFTLPKVYFTAGNPQASGRDRDVLLPLSFTAVRDDATDCMIQIDVL